MSKEGEINAKFSVKGFDVWKALFRARVRKVTFYSKHEPAASRQTFCLGDLLAVPPAGAAVMLTLRDGSVAHQDDQASGRALLYAYIIDEIDTGADGGGLLSRIERQCG